MAQIKVQLYTDKILTTQYLHTNYLLNYCATSDEIPIPLNELSVETR